jgi:hypothetical protein
MHNFRGDMFANFRDDNVSNNNCIVIYCIVIRSVLECGAQIWSGGLIQMQKKTYKEFKNVL